MTEILTRILTFIVVLGVLVFIHELGHFLAAKISGIRVIRFSVGFPPRLFGKKIGETDYCLQLIPLGGYCKMAGMVDETLDPDGIKGEPWEFASKPIPTRMFVLFAGPLMNVLLAMVLFTVFANFTILPDERSLIGSLAPGDPAEQAGLLPGDLILSIDGETVDSWAEMTIIIRSKPLENVTLKIKRDEEIFEKQVTLVKRDNPGDDVDEEVGMLGILAAADDYEWRYIGITNSLDLGFRRTAELTGMIAGTIKSLFTGSESIKAIGGPVMIAKITDEFRRDGIAPFIFVVASLTLSLGLMNLLPVPVLDGGHLMILTIEGILRRQLPLKAKIVVQQIGLAFLLVLMVVITYNDIVR